MSDLTVNQLDSHAHLKASSQRILKNNPAGETTGSKASFTRMEYVPPGGIIPFALITVAAPAQATLPMITGVSPYSSEVHSKPTVGRSFHQLPLSMPLLWPVLVLFNAFKILTSVQDNGKKVNFVVDFGGYAAKINNKNYLSRSHVFY